MVEMILFAKQKWRNKTQRTNVWIPSRGWENDGRSWETGIAIHTILIVCTKQLMRTYYIHRGLYSMLCGDLNGKEVQKGGDICICMADSFAVLGVYLW